MVVVPVPAAPAAVEVIVAASRMVSVAVRGLLRLGCLHAVAIESGQAEQSQCAGSKKQHHMRPQVMAAPPRAASQGIRRILF
jgi:hypothetical protein